MAPTSSPALLYEGVKRYYDGPGSGGLPKNNKRYRKDILVSAIAVVIILDLIAHITSPYPYYSAVRL